VIVVAAAAQDLRRLPPGGSMMPGSQQRGIAATWRGNEAASNEGTTHAKQSSQEARKPVFH